MSERSRDLPRRSCLSTPGSNEKFLAKAPTVPADMTFLDLEDAVAPLEKEAARAKVVDAIKNLPWDDRVLCVRVNAWDTEWTYGDVIEVVGQRRRAPRRGHAAQGAVRRRGGGARPPADPGREERRACRSGHIGIEAQIETARGLINVDEICAASPRLETIIFGPADFAASIEMPVLTGGVPIPEYPGDHFHYVFSRILMAGRANGLQVIDGPFLKVRELDALRDYSHAHPDARLRRQVGAHARPGDDAQRGVLARPRSSSTTPSTSSRPTARRPRRTARARSCSATR